MKEMSYTLELSDNIIKRINATRKASKKKASLIEWKVRRQGCRYIPYDKPTVTVPKET
jgi:hypothetical protein